MKHCYYLQSVRDFLNKWIKWIYLQPCAHEVRPSPDEANHRIDRQLDTKGDKPFPNLNLPSHSSPCPSHFYQVFPPWSLNFSPMTKAINLPAKTEKCKEN